MDLDRPDRVPVMCQMSIGHMLVRTGIRPLTFWNAAEAYAAGLVSLQRDYGFDGILVSLYGHRSDWEKDIRRVETSAEGEVVHWRNGDRTLFPSDDLPVHTAACPRPVPPVATLDPGGIPTRLDYFPVSQGLEFRFDPGSLADTFRRLRTAAGPDVSLHGEVTSPFDYYLHFFGFEAALLALRDAPERARTLLQRFTEGVVLLAEAQAALGLDAVKISSPFAGAGFISPADYRSFVLPFERQVAEAIRRHGAHAYLHTCGDIHDRLELMAESGVSGLECLDPPPLGRVELADAKRRIGRRLFIKGNIDPVNILLQGDIPRVRESVRRTIEAGRPGGGYILSTACAIAPHTPPENVAVLRVLAEEFGTY
jgi:hypothetical protein